MHLQPELRKRWTDAVIEFRLGIPLTWTSNKTRQDFLPAIHEAGFGTKDRRPIALLDLADAESVCADTLFESPAIFRAGDTVLVCYDTGAGMDSSIVEIQERRLMFSS